MIAYRKLLRQLAQDPPEARAHEPGEQAALETSLDTGALTLELETERLDHLLRTLEQLTHEPSDHRLSPASCDHDSERGTVSRPPADADQPARPRRTAVRVSIVAGGRVAGDGRDGRHGSAPCVPAGLRPPVPPGPVGPGLAQRYCIEPRTRTRTTHQPTGRGGAGPVPAGGRAPLPATILPQSRLTVPARRCSPHACSLLGLPLKSILWALPLSAFDPSKQAPAALPSPAASSTTTPTTATPRAATSRPPTASRPAAEPVPREPNSNDRQHAEADGQRREMADVGRASWWMSVLTGAAIVAAVVSMLCLLNELLYWL